MYANDDFQKSRCCSFPLQKTTMLKLSSTLSTQKMLLTQQNIPSPKCPPFLFLFLFSSYILPSILVPLLEFEPPGFLPLQHRNPLHQHGKHTPHYFSCTYEASSLPSVFSLLHHQESIWIRGGLQGTQSKAQNGPTTLPKTDLELMGLSHVGFRSQNYQNQCFTPSDSMNRLNRLNRMLTGRTGCKKKFENLTECSWKSEESMKKNGMQFRV